VGAGFGSLTVSPDGKVAVTGRTADGETFTSASHVGLQRNLMLFSTQKGKPEGSVVGTFGIDSNQVILAKAATMTWWKPKSTDPKARVQKDGLGPLGLNLIGGAYQPPVAPLVALNVSPGIRNATVSFSGATVAAASRSPSTDMDIGATSKAKASETLPTKTTLVINPKLGTFTGSFTLADPNPRGIAPLQVTRAVTYQGVIFSDGGELVGSGFFLLPDLPSTELLDTPATSPVQSGSVALTRRE
jgi:hypothetical protein